MREFVFKLQNFIHTETVLFISSLAAIITMFFIPPTTDYISYLNFRVLSLLFCLMAVVAGFQETGLFMLLARGLLKKAATVRSLSAVLILISFFCSMWITNDVALITFVPFAIMILSLAGQEKHLLKIVVLQTIAANLGSMLTPIGNPQNLYLYTRYSISIWEFLQITFPYTAVSLLLLLINIALIKKEPLNVTLPRKAGESFRKSPVTLLYSILFILCLACVMRVMDYRLTFAIVFVSITLLDIQTLKRIDYPLLLTFVCFFIFVGNIGQITAVKEYISDLLRNKEYLMSISASQIISNVPAAALLSAFTDNYKALILGTDIGGLGTLVASLASIISYKFYCRTEHARPGKYLKVFTLYNIIFLAALCLFHIIMISANP